MSELNVCLEVLNMDKAETAIEELEMLVNKLHARTNTFIQIVKNLGIKISQPDDAERINDVGNNPEALRRRIRLELVGTDEFCTKLDQVRKNVYRLEIMLQELKALCNKLGIKISQSGDEFGDSRTE